MTLMTEQTSARTPSEVLAELRVIAAIPEQSVAVGQLLLELRGLSNCQFRGFLRDLRPDLRRPDAWAQRMIDQASRPGRESLPLPESGGVLANTPPQETADVPSPPAVDGLRRASAPSALEPRAARLFERLRPLLDLSPAARSRRIADLSAELEIGQRTLYRHFSKLQAGGAAALNRKPRADRGQLRISDEARAAFLARRTDPLTRQEPLQVSIRHLHGEFPGEDISDFTLRRLEAAIPKALLMEQREWRATYGALGQWEVEHLNHTHVFDMTDADLFIWDRDGRPPYRPKLTALIDEHTQCCLGGIYTRETPSMAVLQAVLLHSWLPKADVHWPMYGIPKHLHCDNGKVQVSGWLQAVCATIGADLHDRQGNRLLEGIRHAQVRSPWQDGHIERFYGIVHTHFEQHIFPAAYCGRSPQHRREGFRGNLGSERDWQAYPTLQQLNAGFAEWVVSDYHQLHHSRLKMSRLNAWVLGAAGHVHLADRDYLYHALLQRSQCQVRRGQIRLNNQHYWHELLQGYEGVTLAARWDPMDLSKLLVFGLDGKTVLCWAQRQEARHVDNPKHLAEHREQKAAVKRMRGVLSDALQIAPLMDAGEFTQHVAAMSEARATEGIIPFVPSERAEERKIERPSVDEMIDLLRPAQEVQPDEDPIIIAGFEVR